MERSQAAMMTSTQPRDDSPPHPEPVAAPHNGRRAPNGRKGVTGERRRAEPVAPTDYLEQLPSRVLLDRLPAAVIAVGSDGVIVYANPAMGSLIGAQHTALTGRSLSGLLDGDGRASSAECVAALRESPDTVTVWRHADGYRVRAVASKSLLTRSSDPVLLIVLIDVTDSTWHYA